VMSPGCRKSPSGEQCVGDKSTHPDQAPIGGHGSIAQLRPQLQYKGQRAGRCVKLVSGIAQRECVLAVARQRAPVA
jgi:hypothetical protein